MRGSSAVGAGQRLAHDAAGRLRQTSGLERKVRAADDGIVVARAREYREYRKRNPNTGQKIATLQHIAGVRSCSRSEY